MKNNEIRVRKTKIEILIEDEFVVFGKDKYRVSATEWDNDETFKASSYLNGGVIIKNDGDKEELITLSADGTGIGVFKYTTDYEFYSTIATHNINPDIRQCIYSSLISSLKPNREYINLMMILLKKLDDLELDKKDHEIIQAAIKNKRKLIADKVYEY